MSQDVGITEWQWNLLMEVMWSMINRQEDTNELLKKLVEQHKEPRHESSASSAASEAALAATEGE